MSKKFKLDDTTIELKNITITPFEEGKLEDAKDIMYLYYTLIITNEEKKFKFKAYDFPVIDELESIFERVKKEELEGEEITRVDIIPFAGREHGLSLVKYKQHSLYRLHIYEDFGNSVGMNFTKTELIRFIDYINERIEGGMKRYKIEVEGVVR